MNYELAKKLKDAGFSVAGGVPVENLYVFNGEKFQCPTLEELIEACGDKLTILENWGGGWSAYEERQDLIGVEVKGSTPAEAVARLWLSLHKQP